VAVDPPLGVCEQLAAWARTSLRGLGARASARVALRVLDPELLHVTLCFLGNRPVAQVPSIADAVASCTAPVGELSLGAPLWLPPRRPRTLAVEIHDDADGGLGALHARLAGGLATACGFHEERRRFRPHVTVARMRDDPRHVGRETDGERALPATPALSFSADALVLYRSWLSPQGASYEALASHEL
jgi:RNA 2',3'-cyclic 3'-phosphodiesterase